MSTTNYFLDELAYLREAGNEFAKYNPKLTQFLSQGSGDPDVERLLEGFAFLTARVRQKIDDEIPEMTRSLMNLLWPHYMRSIPSMCMTELVPIAGAVTEKTTVLKGMEMASNSVEGTQCLFRTAYDVDLYPIEINQVSSKSSRSRSTIRIDFSAHTGTDLSRINLDTLRLHIHGDLSSTRTIYLWLFRYLEEIIVDVGGGYTHRLPADKLRAVGFEDEDSALPYNSNSFSGYRLLQELFSFPDKFMFVDVQGMQWLQGIPQRSQFNVTFSFSRALPSQILIDKSLFRLHCSPAINLFQLDADPIRLTHNKNSYRVRPQGNEQDHYEVYSIDVVESWSKKDRRKKRLVQFESFDHQLAQSNSSEFYKSSVHSKASGRGLEQFISFHSHSGDITKLDSETVLAKLSCSNGQLAERLSVGDITRTTHHSSTLATFSNITKPTQAVSPQIDGELHWQLIANMSLNYVSLADIKVLKVLLATYDFPARVNRQAFQASEFRLKGLKQTSVRPVDRLYRGVSVRGNQIQLVCDSSFFVNEGDMYLLACVFNEFIRLYSSVNSFTELEVLDQHTGEVYHWHNSIGQQSVL
ncbi:type VI secretion system baseplate subunit TssF [Vibrio sp. S4M6]|uniref:type VI secretion system baseplate subunit TssF n=1 Tax=Vibrio sinus TaxID=2946865 RepID=UPI00202A5F10|nr:type VI secretion system baseplate subunit TssF [Vibrio sinus]MCL9783489.1 type VI secretion system baseplate subunit TssF [Vibrio sinus]